jgi:nucleotide-binding universal stress UspA family protein
MIEGEGDVTMKVLLALDGSTPATIAVSAVKALDLPHGSVIQLLTVIPDEAEILGAPWSGVVMLEPPDSSEQRRAVGARLDDIAFVLATDDTIVQTCIAEGRPATEIVRAADRFGADLIVVGARGQSTVARLLIGSVSSEVVDQARCPVLVARTDRIGRILVAVDGSVDGHGIAAFVSQAPIFGAPAIKVVSVVDAGFPWWAGISPIDAGVAADAYEIAAEAARVRAAAAAGATGDRLAATFGASREISATSIELDGDVGSTIVAEASGWNADVIVLGTHAYGTIHRTLVGSTSRHVLHQATMSVLIARAPAAATSERIAPA